jgi:hypothetical protein
MRFSTSDHYERSFTGAFRRRMIGAEWCNAEGAIYSDAWSDAVLFDDAHMTKGLINDRVRVARYCAADLGTTKPVRFIGRSG